MNNHKFIFFSFIFCCFLSYESSAQCSSNEVEIVIAITTDSYPGETSWQLVDQNGSGYTNATQLTSANTTYTWNICVPNVNCYDFTIFDSWEMVFVVAMEMGLIVFLIMVLLLLVVVHMDIQKQLQILEVAPSSLFCIGS